MTVKHFVANEQETHRSIGGDLSWLTEQVLREIYLKPFEYAVKKGETRAFMNSLYYLTSNCRIAKGEK